MELLSVEYEDFGDPLDGDAPSGSQSACLKATLFVDPALFSGEPIPKKVLSAFGQAFPAVRHMALSGRALGGEAIACLVSGVTLDLQRDLCEWPAGHFCGCQAQESEHEYELRIESIDERVGRFSVQLAVEVVLMVLRQGHFDPRMVWIIDLVRHLRRHPRLRLTPRRVAHLLGCSQSSADWAIQGLERYGYLSTFQVRRRSRSSGGHILVVDDSARIRDLLSRILEWMGYDVITAVNGEEGLILLNWTSYKAIFVDLVMPCLDGATFVQHARAQGVTSPIFVISAYEHIWKAEEVRGLGATAYLSKPFSTVEIEALLREHVR